MTSKAKRNLTIAPPRADRPPLRANLFLAIQKGNAALLPLFPYMHPGAMVPASAIFRGGPDQRYGQFRHHNTVDEIVFTGAANGALLKTGQIFVGGRVHGVDSFLKKESDPKSFALFCITQRQSESGAQSEAISMQCAKCREEVFRYEYDATPGPDETEHDVPFTTVTASVDCFREYNRSDENRTCHDCGHVNEPFPAEIWGWDRYANYAETIKLGRRELLETAANAAGRG